ncbi:MAG: class I SAM-dependent methyltransferase, partial [archaeon]|nr:class I SAM-dependent methyltransferase [archaeon]
MTLLKEIETHWSGRVESYNSSVEKQLATGRSDKWISEVLRDVPAGKKLKVLDVGCGPGFFEMGLASYGFELMGIDYNQDMVNKASENCRERGVTAEFRKMDAQKLEFEDNTFDLVVSRDVLWNLDDPRRAYEEMYRVLKPEGKITVFDGNYYLYAHDKAYEEMNVDRCIKIYHNNDQ